MKKVFHACITAMLAGALGISLAGCHSAGRRTAFAVPENFDTSKDYEISFWAKNDSNKTQTAIYQQAIDDFEAVYPNVHVTMKLYTDYGKIYNDVITNISTGTTPDICITYPDHIATYLTGNNVVVPLDDLLEDPHYGLGGSQVQYETVSFEDVIPAYLEEGKLQGHTYALPYMRSTEACYINKDYVEALGYEVPSVLTWDFIWEVSEAAMKKDPDGTFALNGQNVLIPFLYKSTDNMMIQYLKQSDAGYSDDSGKIDLFNDTTSDLLKTIAEHASTGAFSTFKASGYPANFLNAGQCIFAVDSTAGSTWMGEDAPLVDIPPESMIDFTTVVRPVPQVDPDHLQMISQGPSICLFNKEDPQEVLAAWLFAQYLLTDKVQTSYAETEGYVPVTSHAQKPQGYQEYLAKGGTDHDTHYQVKIDATKLLLDHIDDTFVTPVFNGSTSLRNAAGALIEDVLKAAKRRKTIDESYLDELYDNETSLYRLDQIHAGSVSGTREDLGPLPNGSKALLAGLVLVWLCILAWWRHEKKKQKAKKI